MLGGRLANTAFTVLAPDGKTQLATNARSPERAFGQRGVEDSLRAIADKYPGRALDIVAHTPDFTTVREAINIAACDGRPLVLAWAASNATAARLETQLRALAWSPEFVGRVHWDITVDPSWRSFITTTPTGESGVIIVQPEPYGRTASILASLDLDLDLEAQRATLREASATFDASFKKLSYEAHVQNGLRSGIKWDEIVETADRDDGPSGRRR